MKSLLKVSKLLPKLGTDNPHEKMATLFAIERILATEGISWTDAGLKLHEFLTQIAGISEEEALAAPGPKPAPAWTAAAPAPAPAPTWRAQAFAGPRWPPSPPPKQPDPRIRGTSADLLSLVQEILRKQLWATPAEKTSLQSIEMCADSGLPLSRKQLKFLSDMSLLL